MSFPENGNKPVVLLVEDNAADQQITRRALEKGLLHCELRVASDGEEAMDYLLRRGEYSEAGLAPRPALILLDLNMPRLDGRQVLSHVKGNPMLCTIPVVVFTTSCKEEEVDGSYRLGCNSFVRKPAGIHEFISVLMDLERYWLSLVVLPSR